MAGQLVGRILRSPHAHAKIRKIDTSKAEKLKGVKAVITAADLPDLTNGDSGMYDILDNCMARKKALYDGHAVAAVAAVDARTARRGAEAHRGRLRGAAACDRCRRGDEALGARAARHRIHRGRRAQAQQAIQHRQAQPVRPWRRRSGLQASRFHRRTLLQDRADAPGLYRAACLRRERQLPTEPPTCGSARRAISSTASTAPNCSEWMSPSCASPRRRSAAVSAARPISGPSRSRWRCRARPAGRSSSSCRARRCSAPRGRPAPPRSTSRSAPARTARSPRPRRRCAIPAAPTTACGPSSAP